MKSSTWHKVIWFGLGTFFGGYVLVFAGSLFGKKG